VDDELQRRQAVEIDFWRDSPSEGPGSDPLGTMLLKIGEARWLVTKLERFRDEFAGAATILELGAGQGWASCIVKRTFPESAVTASDISAWAVASVPTWERLFEVSLDGTLACKGSEIPLEPGSVDLVFCFQAAHHFVEHEATLAEVHRVLAPGGVCLFLHEPSCPRYLYRVAKRRANRLRPAVPEDVLVPSELLALAERVGFAASVSYDATPVNREPVETVYFLVLGKLRFLTRFVPCTADYVFRKPPARGE
jgi:SAM-dependent methyltransferase